MELKNQIKTSLETLRKNHPLILNITNFVVTNTTANALLALGASPIMAQSRKELAELVDLSQALLINIGTMDQVDVARMKYAIQEANIEHKPVILDPVGCGISEFRTQISRDLFSMAERLIVRGNSAEIQELFGIKAHSQGVDSLDSSDQAIKAAKKLIEKKDCTVIISGVTDYIVTKNSVYAVKNGDMMMSRITGMGCIHTAITAAFAGIEDMSGLCSTVIMGVAGEIAAQKSEGPGSFAMHFIDALYSITPELLAEKAQIESIE